MTTDNSWHLSKGVPISLIFAIFMQTALAIWWASSVNNRVESLEIKLTDISDDLAQENLRQWARINSAESLAETAINNGRVTAAILERLEKQVSALRDEVKETNRLLRDSVRTP